MATNLENARLNFIYRIEAITPTYTKLPNSFQYVDRLRLSERGLSNTAGHMRSFAVRWLGTTADKDVGSNYVQRECTAGFEIIVAYPTQGSEHDMWELIAKDRFDIIGALWERSTAITGIPGDATADTDIEARWRVSDNINDSEDIWIFTQRWECHIQEVV